jgi:hypothetical protein
LEHTLQASFGLIGKLLSAKPPHPQGVSDTYPDRSLEVCQPA